jgi:hypothetical protein
MSLLKPGIQMKLPDLTLRTEGTLNKEITMRRGIVLGVVVLAACLLSSSAQAAAVTVDVTIKSVNPQSRGITVVYKTELGEKTIELDVSRKAEITVNGEDGTLDSLGPGLKGKVTFDRDLAVVTKIEAKGKLWFGLFSSLSRVTYPLPESTWNAQPLPLVSPVRPAAPT